MPWNNQSGGGGWKSGGGNGGGPWGQGPSGGGQPPDLEEMLKRGQDKVKQVMHGGGMPGPLLFLVAVVACAVIAWQAFFLPRQSGRARRRHALRQVRRAVSAGPAFPPALPDRRGLAAEGDAPEHHRGRYASPPAARLNSGVRDQRAESLMLTGDENIVDIDFVVFWRINDAAKYLFNIQNPDSHGEGGGRERHARGGRPIQHSADPDAGTAEDRGSRAGAYAAARSTATAPASRSIRCNCRRSIRPAR